MFNLTVYEPNEKTNDKNYTIEELMIHGTKFLDAVIYQNIIHKKRFVFAIAQKDFSVNSPSEIGEALFCVFYYLLHYDSIQESYKKEKIPVFIQDIFKNPEQITFYGSVIASFDLDLLDKSWLKKIKLYGIPFRIKHRMSLGVLGHNTLDIIRLFHSKYIGPTILGSANDGPTWNIFPGTGSEKEIREYNEIELRLKQIIPTVYSETQLKQMKDLGFLSEEYDDTPIKPISSKDFDDYNDFIFTNDMLDYPSRNILLSKFTFPLYFYGSLEEGKEHTYKRAFISFKIE